MDGVNDFVLAIATLPWVYVMVFARQPSAGVTVAPGPVG
jgi:hypothetical protein